jgi:ergothioneine biosynthesis protein EgtB
MNPHEPLMDIYHKVRRVTEDLCRTLTAEDSLLQAMPDVSPPKWHLAHTSWFFERFFLRTGPGARQAYDPVYDHLFNSYYESVGPFHPRAQRGLLSRPGLEAILDYRHWVDAQIFEVWQKYGDAQRCELRASDILVIGLNHEQQHQELLLTDIKYNFFAQVLQPSLRPERSLPHDTAVPFQWESLPEGVHTIGYQGKDFAFDNEMPAHRVYIQPIALANRLSTNAEYLQFIEDDGYQRPELWLSEGWQWIRKENLQHPLYWKQGARDVWSQFTLHGWENLRDHEPVCHVSYFEADAFARWQGARLPTESEWEVRAQREPLRGHFLSFHSLHPLSALEGESQIFGDVWEWTSSSYAPYPGYRPLNGALGEYNGKFMVNQYVLRGGSCATPEHHIRSSYRNFFPATARWQFAGVRLAKDLL